jgi:ADP-ribosyl-[dinitrogen reductase] hydrolase
VLAIDPYDRLVLLGGVDAARKPPVGVDAVVSLCWLGSAEVPAPGVRPPDHAEVWLVDSADSGRNLNLDLVLAQAADTVAALRAEGRTVLIHCVNAVSRTPTVAALHAARQLGIPSSRHSATCATSYPPQGPTPLSWPPSTGSARPPLLLKHGFPGLPQAAADLVRLYLTVRRGQ